MTVARCFMEDTSVCIDYSNRRRPFHFRWKVLLVFYCGRPVCTIRMGPRKCVKNELILDFLIHLNSTLDHCQTRNLSQYIIHWFGKVHLDGRRGTLSLPLVKLHVAVQSMTAAGSFLWDSCHILSFSAERIQLESASSRTAPKKGSFRVQG